MTPLLACCQPAVDSPSSAPHCQNCIQSALWPLPRSRCGESGDDVLLDQVQLLRLVAGRTEHEILHPGRTCRRTATTCGRRPSSSTTPAASSREEVFAPVAAFLVADGPDDALRLANDARYGLSGAVFTRDLRRALEFMQGMEAGLARVN